MDTGREFRKEYGILCTSIRCIQYTRCCRFLRQVRIDMEILLSMTNGQLKFIGCCRSRRICRRRCCCCRRRCCCCRRIRFGQVRMMVHSSANGKHHVSLNTDKHGLAMFANKFWLDEVSVFLVKHTVCSIGEERKTEIDFEMKLSMCHTALRRTDK